MREGKLRCGRNGERGQATVEFALVLPLVVFFALVSETTATVTYSAPTSVPLVGALIPDVSLRASVTMRVE